MVSMRMDPTGSFPENMYSRLLDAVGVLPAWITEDDEPAMEQFRRHYPFPTYEDTAGTIDDRGIMYYLGDPPLTPYLEVETNLERIYFYQWAMVGIVDKKTNKHFITRLD